MESRDTAVSDADSHHRDILTTRPVRCKRRVRGNGVGDAGGGGKGGRTERDPAGWDSQVLSAELTSTLGHGSMPAKLP